MTSHGHFLRDAATGLPDEISEIMLTGRNVRIERIVSHGQASPPGYWYDQDDDGRVARPIANSRIGADAPGTPDLKGDIADVAIP